MTFLLILGAIFKTPAFLAENTSGKYFATLLTTESIILASLSLEGGTNDMSFDRNTFAHHPDLPCFKEHVWEWKGYRWCKGCTVSILGIVAGFVFQIATGWLGGIDELHTGFIFAALLLPMVFTAVFDAPRPAKHVSRFLLGFVCGSALLLLFVTDRWLVRLVVVGTFFAIRIPLERLRLKKNKAIVQHYENEHLDSCGCNGRISKKNGAKKRRK